MAKSDLQRFWEDDTDGTVRGKANESSPSSETWSYPPTPCQDNQTTLLQSSAPGEGYPGSRAYNTRKSRYLEVARIVATWSKCLHRHVGVVLVADDVVIATGYNGPARGHSHCVSCHRERGFRELCPAVHAEENVVAQLARVGRIVPADATLYCTKKPCNRCKALLTNAGITRWVWEERREG